MKRRRLVLALISLLGLPATALAQADYPKHPVEFIVPYPPGGPADTTIRLIHPAIQEKLGGAIVLNNKTGGGGAIGTTFVAKAKPDGYTILSTTTGPLTCGVAANPKLGYRLEDFVTIGGYAADPTVIAARANDRFKTWEEMVTYAKANPGKLNYASSGAASCPFGVMEIAKKGAGINIVVVHYQGAAPATTALLGGHVDLAATTLSTMLPLMRAGRLVPLAMSSARRDPAFPDIPTLEEKGLADASIDLYAGLWAPLRTPREIVARLAAALEGAAKQPDVVRKLREAGFRAEWRPGEELQRDTQAYYRKAVQVIAPAAKP